MMMKHKLTMFIVATALLCSCLVGCKKAAETQAPAESEISLVQVVPNDESSAPAEESSKQEEVKLTAAEYLAQLGETNEVTARQKLWQAGYSPAEIKDAVEAAFPKTEVKEESSKPEESSMQEESSKAAEESSQESTETAESRTEESSSGTTETSTGSSGSGSASSGSSSSASSSSSSTQESQTQQQAESSTQESQSSSSGSSASSGSQESQQTQESAPAHVHTWEDVTETVHHDAVTEQVWVVDQEAWDETVEKTEEQEVPVCKCRCGAIFYSDAEWEAHVDYWLDYDDENGTDEFQKHYSFTNTYVYEEVVIGTETIHHDEVGHYETKTVTEAYDEEVVVGQRCSECGATK